MAALETIRQKFGLGITIIIALALLSFIIDPQTLSSVSQSMSSKFDVGEINGKSVSYNDFQKDIDTYTTIYEVMSGSSVQGDQQQKAIRDQAWQALVNKFMLVKNAKAAGLYVGEDEILNLTSGDNVSPMIAQLFADENGEFSKEALIQFVQSAQEDETGRLSTFWNYIQSELKTSQYSSKYGSLFANSNIANPLMIQKMVEENNVSSSVDFTMVPFGYANDTTLSVSSSEIKKYYRDHKDLFKQQASRDIEYVMIEVVPSEEDINAVKAQMEEVLAEFDATDNMKAFLLKNSERQLSEYWYKEGELNTISREVNEFVFNGGNGASGIIAKDDSFYAVRIMDSKNIADSIYMRAIQMPAGVTEINDSLVNVLRENEAAPVTQNSIIPGCEVLFTAADNVPQIVKTTYYGNLLVEVTKKSAPVAKKQVAILEKTALPSKETYSKFYAQANTLASEAAGKYESFETAVAEGGYVSVPMKIYESTERIGTVENAKEVVRWAFEQKKAGKVSDIKTVNQNYFFVVAVKDIHKEGYATVAEAANGIRNILLREKAGEKKAAEVSEKINGLATLDAVAEALGTTVSTKDDITFASLTSYGVDPAFVGAVSAAEIDKLTGPVVGSNGVYVFKVNSRETGSFFTEDDAKTRDAQMQQRNLQMLMYVMMDDYDVKDNRARFF